MLNNQRISLFENGRGVSIAIFDRSRVSMVILGML